MRHAILALFVLAPSALGDEDDAPEVFRFERGRFNKVTVRTDGTCEVKYYDGAISSAVKLTPEDLKTFEELVSEARLREDPPKRSPQLDHLGARGPRYTFDGWLRLRGSDCWVSADGRTADIALWLQRLLTEARFLRGVEDDCWWPGIRPEHLLHPPVFREKLEGALATHEQPYTAVFGLASVAPCEEWARLLEKRLRSGDDQKIDGLAGVLALWHRWEELPRDYRDVRVRLLFETLRDEYAPGGLDQARGRVAHDVALALCMERYKPAAPLVVEMMKTEWCFEPGLEQFGAYALDPLARLLESPNPRVRENAVRAVRSLARSVDEFPEEERQTILRRLHPEFTLRIREIRRHDPDGTAQTIAGHTLVALAQAVLGG